MMRTEDSPFCPPGQNCDVIDLTKDTDMDMIQPESSKLVERRGKEKPMTLRLIPTTIHILNLKQLVSYF